MQRHDYTTTVLTPIHIAMNGEYSLWRIVIDRHDTDKFREILHRVRPDNCIHSITPAWMNGRAKFEVILTEEELSMVKLSIQTVYVTWLQDWIYAKL